MLRFDETSEKKKKKRKHKKNPTNFSIKHILRVYSLEKGENMLWRKTCYGYLLEACLINEYSNNNMFLLRNDENVK